MRPTPHAPEQGVGGLGTPAFRGRRKSKTQKPRSPPSQSVSQGSRATHEELRSPPSQSVSEGVERDERRPEVSSHEGQNAEGGQRQKREGPPELFNSLKSRGSPFSILDAETNRRRAALRKPSDAPKIEIHELGASAVRPVACFRSKAHLWPLNVGCHRGLESNPLTIQILSA